MRRKFLKLGTNGDLNKAISLHRSSVWRVNPIGQDCSTNWRIALASDFGELITMPVLYWTSIHCKIVIVLCLLTNFYFSFESGFRDVAWQLTWTDVSCLGVLRTPEY